MAFYKKVQLKRNGMWYPRSVLVGASVTTEQLSKRLAAESTVSPADVLAVLKAMSGVMGEYMAMGRSVKLDGIGSFYFTCTSEKNPAATEKECSAKQITGVRVRFTPETRYAGKGKKRRAVRGLTDVDIEWLDISTLAAEKEDEIEP